MTSDYAMLETRFENVAFVYILPLICASAQVLVGGMSLSALDQSTKEGRIFRYQSLSCMQRHRGSVKPSFNVRFTWNVVFYS